MSSLSASELFNVRDMIFVITGGGTGSNYKRPKEYQVLTTGRNRRHDGQGLGHQLREKSIYNWTAF